MFKDKRIAIVYDWIDKWGGVERVLLTFYEIFPQADFYTSYFNPEKAGWAENFKIKTSFIQKLPTLIRGNRIVSLPFYPYAFESFNFGRYDLTISVTSSFAKSIITKPKTTHICYLLTPTRYLWLYPNDYIAPINKLFLSSYLSYLKKWDFTAAYRPDKIISISKTVAERCQRYYQRNSPVIYPPFDTEYWNNIKSKIQSSNVKSNSKLKCQNYYLVVSRLEPYKKVDLAINIFNKKLPSMIRSYKDGFSRANLVIVGEGSEEKKLKKIAGKNILFLEKLTDEELAFLYVNAQALIMPQEEDFGYVSLEAQFFVCPVIAYKKGGATETVIDKKTGIFFEEQTEKSLVKALERFHTMSYNLRTNTQKLGLKNIEKFDKKKFVEKFLKLI